MYSGVLALGDWSVSPSSKFISVNVGIAFDSSGVGMLISKSVGNGSEVSSATIGVSICGGVVVNALNADVCMRPTLLRARIKAKRNSAGMSSGRGAGISTSSGPSVGVSDSGVGSGVGSAGVGFKNAGTVIFGMGIVINGFLVRMISVVVAT